MSSNQDMLEEEFEGLMAIYSDDFCRIDDKNCSVFLVPVPGGGDDEENTVAVKLLFTFPAGYPIDDAVAVRVEPVRGLRVLEVEELQRIVDDEAASGIGAGTVFTICMIAKEYVDDRAGRPSFEAEDDDEFDRKAEKNHGVEKLSGTMVTPETFAEWHRKFIAEKKAAGEIQEKTSDRLTGKQQFIMKNASSFDMHELDEILDEETSSEEEDEDEF